jgi:hypothetical protein
MDFSSLSEKKKMAYGENISDSSDNNNTDDCVYFMYDISTRLFISQCISLTHLLDKKEDRSVIGETK